MDEKLAEPQPSSRRSGSPAPLVRKPSRKGTSSKRASTVKAGDASKGDRGAKAFQVAVRCRPLLPHEREKQGESVLTLSKGSVTVTGGDEAERGRGHDSPRMASPRRERSDQGLQTVKAFSFDHVYDEFCTQEEVYAQFVAPFTAQFIAGYNVTLFAYGQTGTGKTHTVIGGDTDAERGVVPRFVEEVFAHVQSEAKRAEAEASSSAAPHLAVYNEADAADARPILSDTTIEKVGVSVLEVYEGRVFDLLSPERSRAAAAAWAPYGTQLSLELEAAPPGGRSANTESRCYWVRGGERVVRTATEALHALSESIKLRHTASHALNECSSRSHCIFSLQVHRKRTVYKLERVDRGEWRYVAQRAKTSTCVTRSDLVGLAG